MADYLDVLAKDAMETIKEGYYETIKISAPSGSLKKAILECEGAPIIAEIKFVSPSMGTLRMNRNLKKIANDIEKGGAVSVSVLTEPKHFEGDIRYFYEVQSQVNISVLMKDIILSPVQIEAAHSMGASAILLIQTLFERGYCEKNLQEMIELSHSLGLEVLLETHTEDEFLSALKAKADLIGINNRDVRTLEVNLEITKRILTKHPAEGKIIVSESGINSPNDIRFLRKCGAHAFLVGSAVMKANNIKEKVRELVRAL